MNKIKVEIGSKAMSDLTAKNILQIVLIEGCSPCLQYWDKPILTDFTNTLFSNTMTIDYHSFRKHDKIRSSKFTFFFNFKDFSFHYMRDLERNHGLDESKETRISLVTLRYLIEQGFNVPIY